MVVVVIVEVGLTASELRLPRRRFLVLAAAVEFILGTFSLPSVGGAVFINEETRLFLDGMGEVGGTKFVIFLRGSLSFEGPNGGFFSGMVLRPASFGRVCIAEG